MQPSQRFDGAKAEETDEVRIHASQTLRIESTQVMHLVAKGFTELSGIVFRPGCGRGVRSNELGLPSSCGIGEVGFVESA